MEQNHDLLLVEPRLSRILNNQRCSQQRLLLQSMSMHPVSARSIQRKSESAIFACADQRQRGVGDAIAGPGRRQAVPVDNARLCGLVLEQNIEITSGDHAQAGRLIWSHQTENLGRLAIHLKRPAQNGQGLLASWFCSGGHLRQHWPERKRSDTGSCTLQQIATFHSV